MFSVFWYFFSITDRLTYQVNYILDVHRFRESTQKNQPSILNTSLEIYDSPIIFLTDRLTDKRPGISKYRVASLPKIVFGSRATYGFGFDRIISLVNELAFVKRQNKSF